MGANEELRRNLSAKNRRRCEREYRVEQMVRAYRDLFLEAVAEGERRFGGYSPYVSIS
ncbi:MAG: hypothetical protein H5T84_06930 [Thermoleophilia bacterium]|nr:hypothetical protein [Thermoleophilia bacterium]